MEMKCREDCWERKERKAVEIVTGLLSTCRMHNKKHLDKWLLRKKVERGWKKHIIKLSGMVEKKINTGPNFLAYMSSTDLRIYVMTSFVTRWMHTKNPEIINNICRG